MIRIELVCESSQGIGTVSVELELLGIFHLKDTSVFELKFVEAMCESRIELVHYLQLCYSTQFNVTMDHQQDIEKLSYVHVYHARVSYALAHIK